MHSMSVHQLARYHGGRRRHRPVATQLTDQFPRGVPCCPVHSRAVPCCPGLSRAVHCCPVQRLSRPLAPRAVALPGARQLVTFGASVEEVTAGVCVRSSPALEMQRAPPADASRREKAEEYFSPLAPLPPGAPCALPPLYKCEMAARRAVPTNHSRACVI